MELLFTKERERERERERAGAHACAPDTHRDRVPRFVREKKKKHNNKNYATLKEKDASSEIITEQTHYYTYSNYK